jgi:hypothetical protein
MASKRGFIVERDRHGRERIVLARSSSHNRRSNRELLNEAEEREQVLIAENQALRTQLSFAQNAEWNLRNLRVEHQRLADEHYHCRNLRAQLETQVREVRRIEDKLEDEEDKSERLGEKIRLMKRGSVDQGYRVRYEEKVREVELLRQRLLERDGQLRIADTRLADKNTTVLYLKNFLRERGFRVEG